MKNPTELILVYDGLSGVRAMLLDVVKKAVGREDCPLCAITYSPVGRRASWNRCETRLGMAVREMHRDELPSAWGIGAGELPCVLALTAGAQPTVLLDRDAIVACGGRAEALEEAIRRALTARNAPQVVPARARM
jgi:hypothetical protein